MSADVLSGFLQSIAPSSLMATAIGVLIGLVVGMIPGMTISMGIIILLPLTFVLEPAMSIALLLGPFGAAFGFKLWYAALQLGGSLGFYWLARRALRAGVGPSLVGALLYGSAPWLAGRFEDGNVTGARTAGARFAETAATVLSNSRFSDCRIGVEVADSARPELSSVAVEDSGRTGLLAMAPLFHFSDRDLWQYHMIGKG